MSAKIWIIAIVSLLVLSGIVIGGVMVYNHLSVKPAVVISGYYDADGNLITGKAQAVVSGVEGVRFVTFKINARNIDTVPLTFKITNATPSSFYAALPRNELTVSADSYATWDSTLVDILPFVNTTQPFTVTVEASSPLRQSGSKTSTMELRIDPDPQSGFTIDIVSESNQSSGQELPPPPEQNQTQNQTQPPEPPEVPDFETNAVAGSYNEYKSGTWIKVDQNNDGILEQYNYASSITSGSCIGTFVTTTPEGYQVNKYTGSSGLSIHICSPTGAGYKRYKQ